MVARLFFIFEIMTKTIFCGVKSACCAVAVVVSSVMSTLPAVAQKQVASDWSVLPKKFSYTGKPQIVACEEDDENGNTTVHIYDETLAETKTFAVPGFIGGRTVCEERFFVPGEYRDTIVSSYTCYVDNLDEAIRFATAQGAESHTKKGDLHTFAPLEIREPEHGTDEITYIRYIYREGESEMTVCEVRRLPVYSDWKQTSDEVYYDSFTDSAPSIFNCDAEIIADDVICELTQTLFNSDEKYEYLMPVTEWVSEPNTLEEGFVYLGGEPFCTLRRHIYEVKMTGYKVMNEDGAVLNTFDAGGDDNDLYYYDDFCLVMLGGKVYFSFSTPNGYTFYEIDSINSSVRKVLITPVSIYPRMVRSRADERVTIEAGGELASRRREVMVTDMNGRLVQSHAIAPGCTSIQVATGRLQPGIYNFTVSADGRRVDNGKIIVR